MTGLLRRKPHDNSDWLHRFVYFQPFETVPIFAKLIGGSKNTGPNMTKSLELNGHQRLVMSVFLKS